MKKEQSNSILSILISTGIVSAFLSFLNNNIKTNYPDFYSSLTGESIYLLIIIFLFSLIFLDIIRRFIYNKLLPRYEEKLRTFGLHPIDNEPDRPTWIDLLEKYMYHLRRNTKGFKPFKIEIQTKDKKIIKGYLMGFSLSDVTVTMWKNKKKRIEDIISVNSDNISFIKITGKYDKLDLFFKKQSFLERVKNILHSIYSFTFIKSKN